MTLMKRRSVVKGLGATLGGIALRGYAAHGDAHAYFTHGVASGDPLADRVMLWTRVIPADSALNVVPLRWQVATDQAFSNIVASGMLETSALQDFTAKIDAHGLEPNTHYYYRFVALGAVSAVGRTKTLPVGAVSEFKAAVCSCSNYSQGYFNAYRDIATRDVDAVIHLGDYLYEYARGVYDDEFAVQKLGRQLYPAHELVQLEDYRTRYGLYRSDPDLQAAHAAHPWICVWDDHELANDTWRDGAQNHNEGEGDFHVRMAAARQAYHEWMPIRTAAQSNQQAIYRRFMIGDLADLLMLDARLEGRDEQLNYVRDLKRYDSVEAFREQALNDPNRTILGADQENWLANQLAASNARGATWQVVGQQVLMGRLLIPELPAEAVAEADIPAFARPWIETMVGIAEYGMPLNLDAWDGYPASRERMQQAMRQFAMNPVVLAGDSHNAWAFNLRTESGDAVGVELGTPGISSPGMERYLPIDSNGLAAALRKSSPELFDLDIVKRGWTELTLTPEAMTAQWRFVSNILTRDYEVLLGPVMTCLPGSRQFS